MARFRIIAGGQSRLYDILDDALTAGSAAGNAIRLDEPGVAEVHVRVWRDIDGVWVSAVTGASITINGKATAQHRLRHGDRVALGPGLALEFIDPSSARPEPRVAPVRRAGEEPAKPTPARGAAPRRSAPLEMVVPSAAREAQQLRGAKAKRQAQRRERPQAQPRWHLFSGLLLLSAAVVWISLRVLASSIGGQSAADLLALAETQLVRGNPQLALQTAQTALARADGDAELTAKVAALEAKVEQATRASVDGPLLANARQALENLKTFERAYLVATPTSRPACREFVRVADEWRERYAAVCERYPESSSMTHEVSTLRARYAASAELDQADDVDDVLFAARRATRLRRPRYRDAVQALDSFLARGGDAAAIERAKTYRAELVDDGRAWFDQKIKQLEREFERGRWDAVLSEVAVLMAESVLDEWKPELEARARTWKQSVGR